jgi:DNA-binding transcriptional LysR family regulator
MGESIEADMAVVRLTPALRFAVVGSPAYLRRRGRPEAPEDLQRHACVRMRRSGGALAPWRVRVGARTLDVAVDGPLIVNDFPTMLGAALGGVGLAQVPEPIARADVRAGRLEEVLAAHAPTTAGVFLYHPGRRQVLPKLRAFIDHLRAHPLEAPEPATRAKRAAADGRAAPAARVSSGTPGRRAR